MQWLPDTRTFEWQLKYVRLCCLLVVFLAMLAQMLNELNGFYV